MSEYPLHKVQMSILHALRYAEQKRFSDLMYPTGLTSDTFKFHIRKLTHAGYVEKTADGTYHLSAKGKEYANILDEQRRAPKKQPKIAIMLLVSRNEGGEKQFLLYQRKVNPFYGYWAAMSDAILWGETFEEAALKRLKKHAGYEADFTINSIVRTRNFVHKDDKPAEDIVFVIMEASNLRGKPHGNYAGGVPEWLSLSKLLQQDRYFASLPTILESAATGKQILEVDTTYPIEDF